VPAFALQLAFGEMSTLVLDGQKVVPAHLLETGFEFQFPLISLALKDVLKPEKDYRAENHV
jgi:NAD dependent epimerase/dehydratase family enzyme